MGEWWAGRHCVFQLCGVGHAWTLGLVGLESGGSFRTVALAAVSSIGLPLRGEGWVPKMFLTIRTLRMARS